MGIPELIAILNNRLNYLNIQRNEAVSRGDLSLVSQLDVDIAKTTGTLSVLHATEVI